MIIALMVALQGCSLFETRNPAAPESGANVWIPPIEPGDVLTNIERAFALQDANLYMKSFAEPGSADSAFSYFPDPASVGFDTSLFSDWGYFQEQAFALNLFNNPDFITEGSQAVFQFTPESEPPGEINPVYLESYNIAIDTASEEIPTEYTGKARITFQRNNNGNWVIIRWEDEQAGEEPTYSRLKSLVSN